MVQYDLHSIALFLAGQYPNLFGDSYDKLDFKLELREVTSGSITESITDEMQRTATNDKDFFYMGLHRLEKITRTGYGETDTMGVFLEKLDKDIPRKVMFIDCGNNSSKFNVKDFSDKLKGMKEAEFCSTVVMPILQGMGYENVEYKGTVRESDRGTDFYVMQSKLLSGLYVYSGVQVKSVKMSNGSSTAKGSEYSKLVQEIDHAFKSKHIIFDGREVRIDEMLIFNNMHIHESVRIDLFKAEGVEGKKVRVWGGEGVLGLMNELGMME